MAGKSAMPLLLAAGGAALLLSGKKKKKKKTANGGAEPYTPPENGEEEIPYIPPSPAPKPQTPSRPAGNPPRGDQYDGEYWGSTTPERLMGIRQHFVDLGYPVQVSPHPMNILGPKGNFELENIDGTMGKLGGDDDKPNATVKKFQHEYNMVSRLNKAEKIYPQAMGGLDEDGAVGPYTLNGLRFAKEGLPGGKTWSDLLMMATNKGIA